MPDISTGSADAHALAAACREGGPRLLITDSAQEARRLKDEVAWFDPALTVLLLPDWETLPYDHFSPHPDLVSERMATLYQVRAARFDLLIVPATTAMGRLPPPEFLLARTLLLRKGEKLDIERLRADLTRAGYSAVQQVVSPGEYSVRGGIVDLFPMGSALPYRIELFDDEVESLRAFDADTQRSVHSVGEIRLLPAREYPLDADGIARFRAAFRERFEGDASRRGVYRDVSKGIAPGGIEYWLPLFFDRTATLFDYLPAGVRAFTCGDVSAAARTFWDEAKGRHRLLAGEQDRPLLPPEELFLASDALFIALNPHGREALGAANGAAALPPLQVDRHHENPLHRLAAFLDDFPARVLVLAGGPGRRETMLEFFASQGLKPAPVSDWADFFAGDARFALGIGPLHGGFRLDHDLAVITETELYALPPKSRERRAAQKATQVEHLLRDLSELKVGDPVVHADHGIGRYLGLAMMDLGDGETEFLKLEYAGGDLLYVPVANLSQIGRYAGASPEAAPLHKLGGDAWDKAKRRALRQARDTAAELLNLYARRAAREGHAFKLTPHDYAAFATGFGFEETPDQAEAIVATLRDMQSGKPMDRLVCGDVGFGKTEVALRAAFVAVADGRQVAILCPTTLLAEQHYQTFTDRFSDWPVKVAELSRFRSAKEVSSALAGLSDGSIDIVIGTHKLISPDVKFSRLGLVIIDEEHRFGVRQKERFKELRAEVDVLTLTATPIPRTLAMSLEGLREISVIATAPARRLAIKTFVARENFGLVREAVLRELKRGGQVYYLYNEVETMPNMAEKLAHLLPEATLRTAHGQMPERELEAVMRDFHHARFNLLLCSTIIETGIDVPNANTIVIHRADKFGLAQLHQLRGRVGRSHHQAYAYLLTPEEAAMTPNARKRLEAIQMMEDLGAGFFLAMHDLEIRGAGEVLGESQSGEMQEVGFSLYNDMLAHAVGSLRQGKEPDLTAPLGVVSEINLHAPALLPEDYCPDVHERLVLYKRLANCADPDQLTSLTEELIDRFGPLPDPARVLLASHRLRIAAHPLGIAKIDAAPETAILHFRPNPPIDPARILKLIQTRREFKLAGQDKLRWEIKPAEPFARAEQIRALMAELSD